jgi:thioesterase domain-containing protein
MLNPRAWPAYSARLLRDARELLAWKVRSRLRRTAAQVFAAAGWPLPEALRQARRIIREAGVAYQPEAYDGPIVLFRASKQPMEIIPDPTSGWHRYAAGGLTLHEVPGSHQTILQEPRVGTLAALLKPYLDPGTPNDETGKDSSPRPILPGVGREATS